MSARRLHLALTVGWAVFAIPVLVWWKDSIVLILMISIYANVVGHWSAYQAARSEKAAQSEDC